MVDPQCCKETKKNNERGFRCFVKEHFDALLFKAGRKGNWILGEVCGCVAFVEQKHS